MCVWLLGTAFRTRLVRSVPIAGDSYLCPLCTRYAGDSKKTNNRWSRDSYRFVQWRSDDDSNSKPRHFMWVSALVSFS